LVVVSQARTVHAASVGQSGCTAPRMTSSVAVAAPAPSEGPSCQLAMQAVPSSWQAGLQNLHAGLDNKLEERKDRHNRTERRRSARINTLIDQLKNELRQMPSAMPAHLLETMANDRGSKASVLEAAVYCIGVMGARLRELEGHTLQPLSGPGILPCCSPSRSPASEEAM